jgi:UDP-N-acetylmuramyl pentapeptide synthase
MKRKLSVEERKKYIALRRQFKKPVIGITGQVGKSTTLKMIKTILESKGKALYNKSGHGSWASNIKLLNQLNNDYDYVLFEFDYKRGDNFAEVLRLIKPTIGIVTNIGDAHLNYLGKMMNIALRKTEVVKYLARGGVAILNKDDELSSVLANYITNGRIVKYGLSSSSDYYATDIQHLGPGGILFNLNDNYPVNLPIYSTMDVYSVLASISACEILGFNVQEMINIFHDHYSLPNGHGKMHAINGHYVIDESYQATSRSLSKAAKGLIGFKPYTEQLILVVGDMAETGVDIEEEHMNMGYFLSALPIDHLITVGSYAKLIGKASSLVRSKDKKVHHVNSIDELLETLANIVTQKSAISLKGTGLVSVHRVNKMLKEKMNLTF